MSARCAALMIVTLLSASSARAETLNWLGAKLPNGPGDPWPWALDGRKANPGGIPVAQIETALKNAFQHWQDASCSYIEFSYTGRDTTHGIRESDGANVMGAFIESRTEDQELYDNALGGGAALAVALPVYYGGTIYGCDVAFNALDYKWHTDGSSSFFDVESVANQETGHCLGLDHYSGDVKAVMYPFVSIGDLRRTLQPHDVDNACQIYPQSGQVGSPCPSGSCGGALTCVGAAAKASCTKGCDPAVANSCPVGFSCKASTDVAGSAASCFFGGDAAILVGAPCTNGSRDCGPGGQCIPYDSLADQWRAGYCTASCGANPCPANASCYDLDVGGKGRFCMKDCRPGFGDCRGGYACEPLSNGKGRCRPACDTDSDCVPGATCRSCDGLCVSLGKAGGNVGDPCATDGDCPTGGFCRKDFPGGLCTLSCATRCTACPQGSVCLNSGPTGEKLCFKGCSAPADCRSGFGCFQDRSGSGCKAGCTSESDCPVGLACLSGSCVSKEPPVDGGCVLCSDRDGAITPGASDGGSVEPQPISGCGCASGAVAAPLLVLPLALLRRRREGEG